MPGKVKGNIAKLEQLKSKQPELASVIDKRLPALHKRLGFFREPVKALEEALGRICTNPAHFQKLFSRTISRTLFTCQFESGAGRLQG